MRTDRYGHTSMADIAPPPTLEAKVTNTLRIHGVLAGPLHTYIVTLIRTHPALTVKQAVDYAIARFDHAGGNGS